MDMIALVTGVPTLLMVVLVAMARFEATVAPDLESGEDSRVESMGSRPRAHGVRSEQGRGDSLARPAPVDRAEHIRAA